MLPIWWVIGLICLFHLLISQSTDLAEFVVQGLTQLALSLHPRATLESDLAKFIPKVLCLLATFTVTLVFQSL